MKNKKGLCLECPPRMHAPQNFKSDDSKATSEAQEIAIKQAVIPFSCACIFSLTLSENHFGMFKRGDVLSCTTDRPVPGSIAILERPDIGRWPIPFDKAGQEIDAGARVVGMALSMKRQLVEVSHERL
jgi:hypothetical protein